MLLKIWSAVVLYVNYPNADMIRHKKSWYIYTIDTSKQAFSPRLFVCISQSEIKLRWMKDEEHIGSHLYLEDRQNTERMFLQLS